MRRLLKFNGQMPAGRAYLVSPSAAVGLIPVRPQVIRNARLSGVVIATDRTGFTLIELLVAITIVLILSAVTITSFNFSVNADRVRSAARQFQSFLAGARDKAIYANDIRGVRLLLDPNDNHTVSAMQYIGAPQQEVGTLQNDISDITGHTMMLYGSPPVPTRWSLLRNRGFLRVGCRIQIPSNTGAWYTVTAIVSSGPNNPEVILDRPLPAVVGSTIAIPFGYILELSPGVLGEAQPVPFPRGVVIDLDGSRVPNNWRPVASAGFAGSYAAQGQTQMDILFTPRGTVVGDCAALGMLHLHFAEAFDVLKWHTLSGRSSANYALVVPPLPASPPAIPPVPIDSQVARNRIVATLAPRTGNVSVYYVNQTTTGAIGPLFADDPFVFAETGQVANK